MTEDDRLWTQIARKLEDDCARVNRVQERDGRKAIAFDLDAGRHMIRRLREADAALPRINVVCPSVTEHGPRWVFVFRWSRSDGQAWVSVDSNGRVEHAIICADRTAARCEGAPLAAHDLQPFLHTLGRFVDMKRI